MTDSRTDMLFLGVFLTMAGFAVGFDWRIGVAVACYAVTLAVVRAVLWPSV